MLARFLRAAFAYLEQWRDNVTQRDIKRLLVSAKKLNLALGKQELPGLKLLRIKEQQNDNGGWWTHLASWRKKPSLALSLDRYPSSARRHFWVGFWSNKWAPLEELFPVEPAKVLLDADSANKNGVWVLDPPLPHHLYNSPLGERYSGEKYFGYYESDDELNTDRAVQFISRVVLLKETKKDALLIDIGLIERNSKLSPAQKEQLILARRGQGKFRSMLDEIWQSCPLSKHSTREILRASHIVSWAEARDDQERLDPYNGILLSANLDALFDRHLISFDESGCLSFSKHLDRKEISRLNLDGISIAFDKRHKPYLKRHWERFQTKQNANRHISKA
jgi:hypothetical protein